MIDVRTKREAETVLYALNRAWATEGDFALSSAELADRIGNKGAKHVELSVIDYMLAEGWIVAQSDGLRLTDLGRVASFTLSKNKQN